MTTRFTLAISSKTWSRFSVNNLARRRCHSRIRNVGIMAHIDAGKTTTSEQMLFHGGATKYVGRVDSGDTVMDFLPQERERGITISAAAISFKWRNHMINLIDTPGHVDFTIEVERSVRVLDGVVLVVDAVAGVQAQTMTVWKQASKQRIPALLFVNKMDRRGANFTKACESVQTKLLVTPIIIQIPIGSEETFEGVVDLLTMTKFVWRGEANGKAPPIPIQEALSNDDSLYDESIAFRRDMLETLAQLDEVFMDTYLKNEDNPLLISVDDTIRALRRCCIKGDGIPAICGSALKGKGVEQVLNSIIAFLPSPAERPLVTAISTTQNERVPIQAGSKDLCALIFKVVYSKERGPMAFVRVFSGSLSQKQVVRNSTKGAKERINQLLHVSADDYELVDEIQSGSVGCIVGLKSTTTGDTLVGEHGVYRSCILDGLSIPPPVFAVSVEPELTSQQVALEEALSILKLEDPSLVVESQEESGQLILRGLGELHLEIVCDRIQREFNVKVTTGRAYIAFRESIDLEAEVIRKTYNYERVLVGKKLFASVTVDVKPLADKTAIPVTHILEDVKKSCTADEFNSLLDGTRAALSRGPLGYPIVGCEISVIGLMKDANTTPGAIRACVALLLDEIFRSDQKVLLEPIMRFEAEVSNSNSAFVGDVLSDLAVNRRAHIHEIIPNGATTTILASVPLSQMLGYASKIRSMTQGEGAFSMEYDKHAVIDVDTVRSLL